MRALHVRTRVCTCVLVCSSKVNSSIEPSIRARSRRAAATRRFSRQDTRPPAHATPTHPWSTPCKRLPLASASSLSAFAVDHRTAGALSNRPVCLLCPRSVALPFSRPGEVGDIDDRGIISGEQQCRFGAFRGRLRLRCSAVPGQRAARLGGLVPLPALPAANGVECVPAGARAGRSLRRGQRTRDDLRVDAAVGRLREGVLLALRIAPLQSQPE